MLPANFCASKGSKRPAENYGAASEPGAVAPLGIRASRLVKARLGYTPRTSARLSPNDPAVPAQTRRPKTRPDHLDRMALPDGRGPTECVLAHLLVEALNLLRVVSGQLWHPATPEPIFLLSCVLEHDSGGFG